MTPASVEELVHRQVLRWESAKRALSEALAEHPPGGAPVPPTIAISRQPHSGGAALGQRVAERLDYGFFGRELIEEIERAQGVQRQLVAGLDERIRGAIDRWVLDALRRDSFTESRYLEYLVRTLRTLAERGMVVIVGRGASQILPPETTLRVLVVAPVAFRVERLERTRGILREDAEQVVAREDRARRDFLRHQLGVAADDPVDYDLVVNAERLSVEGGANLVLEALADRFPTALPAPQRAAAAGR